VTGSGGLRYDRYQVNGRVEWLMRIGPENGVPILFIPPLFEELNRTRALLAGVMRALAAEGMNCTLPDLPGTGESERDLSDVGWQEWRDAVAAVADSLGADLLIASIRGGALLDATPARAHWRLAPVEGSSLIRDLARTSLAGGEGGAGYDLAPRLRGALVDAKPADLPAVWTVRLASDPRPADFKLEGPALWRRAEPQSASELTASIASDVMAWSRACAAS
jgi:pimeloyl-ACP methyl ester carboxylesterase